MAATEINPLKKRQYLDTLWTQLDNEFSSHETHVRDVLKYTRPTRARFTVSETNKGDRRNQAVLDSTALFASRTARAGLLGGMTSPARPWKRLKTPDPKLMESGNVRSWLHVVNERMDGIFLGSNLYNTLPIVYGDCLDVGTGCMIVEEDFDRVIRTHAFPVGSYRIAVDFRGRVNVFGRQFRMTVRNLVAQFGRNDERTGKPDWSNISLTVRNLYESGNHEAWIDVRHIIMPSADYDHRKPASKRFTSVYYEVGHGSTGNQGSIPLEHEKFLRRSGYDYFPVLAPRWAVTSSEDSYGVSCPGMDTLGDNKQLHHYERLIAKMMSKQNDPTLKGPSSLLNQPISMLPGGFNADDSREGRGLTPLYEVDPRIQEIEFKQEQIRGRIRRGYFEDLFLMTAMSDRRMVTAREIDQRHEEKLIALGEVLEQFNTDLLGPLVDITFNIMARQNLLPPPPPELEGVPLQVEYVSIMAQAQKALGLGSHERFVAFITGVAQIKPDVLAKWNANQQIDDFADSLGLNPEVVNTDEEANEILAAQAAAAQQEREVAMAREAAGAVRDMSGAQVDPNAPSVLTELLDAARGGAVVQ